MKTLFDFFVCKAYFYRSAFIEGYCYGENVRLVNFSVLKNKRSYTLECNGDKPERILLESTWFRNTVRIQVTCADDVQDTPFVRESAMKFLRHYISVADSHATRRIEYTYRLSGLEQVRKYYSDISDLIQVSQIDLPDLGFNSIALASGLCTGVVTETQYPFICFSEIQDEGSPNKIVKLPKGIDVVPFLPYP